jgi:hypothetical protein
MAEVATCFKLLVQDIRRAVSFAFESEGSSMAARIAIMAMTTRSSINVNPDHGSRESWRVLDSNLCT